MFTVFVNLSAKSEVLSLRKKYLVGIKEGGGAIFNIKIFLSQHRSSKSESTLHP